MNRLIITLYLLFSISFSQVIPTDIVNKVDIKNIPEYIPSINTGESNILFDQYSYKEDRKSGSISYLKINSFYEGNYQIKIKNASFPKDAYLAFYDENQEIIYGPYTPFNSSLIFPSVMDSKEIIIIYFEPYGSKTRGSFVIEEINSIDDIPYFLDIPNSKIRKTRERPILMVTGYWPPTNEMIRHFSQNLELNPDGWQGENWRDLGFDVVSFFPQFDPPDCNNCGQGYGDLEVDYQDTSEDFWRIIDDVKPSGIITFSRGFNNNSWELESNVSNWVTWVADYTQPYFPTPSPPDDSVPNNHNRGTALPITLIEDALDNSDIDVNCYIDQNGNSGQFLSEFMGYHGMWHHQSSIDTDNPCVLGGHIHVGGQLSVRTATEAAELTIETVIEYLDNILIIPGDINDDEILNIQDIIQLISYILENNEPNQDWLNLADLNDDGNINVQDIITLVNIILDI